MKNMQIRVLLFTIALIFIMGIVDAKKKRTPLDKRPTDMEPELYCNSCQAIVREVLLRIGQSKKEYDVADALQDLCQRKLSGYEYPPPEMAKGCHAFISHNRIKNNNIKQGWDEVLEVMLTKRASNESIENDICNKKTKACLGVDPKNKKKDDNNSQFIQINNKNIPISPDGSLTIDGSDL